MAAKKPSKSEPVRYERGEPITVAERVRRLEDALAWANGESPEGYPEFMVGPREPPFWWRMTMMAIANGTITTKPVPPPRRKK